MRDKRVVRTRDLCKSYFAQGETVAAVRNVTVQFESGKFYAIVGHSGSGKSSLLNLLGGMDRPTSGTILIHGQDLAYMSDAQQSRLRNQEIGFIFQQYNLLLRLNVQKNMELPFLYGDGASPVAERIAELIHYVGLSGKERRFPTELSGGEQQRVAIARSLVHRPAVLLADEPTGNLDEANSRSIVELFLRLAREQGIAVVMVTHNQALTRLCDRVQAMEHGVLKEWASQSV